MRHGAGHAVAGMRLRGDRRQRQGRQARQDAAARPARRASSHCFARGSVGAMPHSSSAAGHRPKRNTTRAASAAACVPTCAPIEALVAELIAGTQRGSRCRLVLCRLGDRVGVAGGDEAERVEDVDLRHGDFVGDAAEMARHAIGQRGADAVAHLDVIAMDRDAALRIDLDRARASSPRRCHNPW